MSLSCVLAHRGTTKLIRAEGKWAWLFYPYIWFMLFSFISSVDYFVREKK
jgi:hypothetical protein